MFSLDPKYAGWFPYDNFNQFQQQSLPSILKSDENIVISAPTGSGKTTLFEMAMIRSLEIQPTKKILYLSPMRALCTEKMTLWSEKFADIGKSCIELIGGDSAVTNEQVDEADLYITTPEKWDYMTRSTNIIDSIGLILIDEVHILNEQRGAVLEAIMSRIRLILANKSYRIIAVSATIPNTHNLATWLRCPKTNQAAKILKFPDSMRPVPLKTHVVSVPMNGKNGFTFDFGLNYKLPEIVSKYSDNKPTLIFCSTRKSTIKTADFLASNNSETGQEGLLSVPLEDKHLQELISKHNLAYHHAGLSSNDREIVETLFRQNRIRVLCSTSTLAIGVNLPAHLVIIKSTLQYTSETGYTEYSELDLRQMIGRAGRAGYDSQGIAVILTSTQTEHLYRTISEGKLEIDSKLLDGFIEFLNTEISNGNIKSFNQAMQWLSFTFLYTRMKQNPAKYSLKPSEPIDQQIKKSMNLYLDELVSCGVIERKGEEIISTSFGQAMAHNFIKLKTFKHLLKSNFISLAEIADLLRLLSQSPDLLAQIPFRGTDKALLHKISNCPRLIYPLTGKVDWETWKKPFLLVQIALQSELVEFESKLTPTQRADQQTCIDYFCRLLKFIIEVAVQRDLGLLLRNSLELLSSLNGRSWHSNSKLLQQIPGIGQVGSNSLFIAGIRSIDAIKATDDSRLEILLKRNPPFGRNIKKSVTESFPSISFDCELKDRIIKISLKSVESISSFQGKQVHLLVLAYTNPSTCRKLLYDQISLSLLRTALNRTVNIKSCTESSYSCSLMFEDWSGLNQNICFDIETKKCEDIKEVIIDEKSEIDLSSDFDFEDDIQTEISDYKKDVLSSRHRAPHPNIPLSPLSTRSQTPSKLPISGVISTSCKHTCKDKFNCAHVCCKAGLLKRSAETVLTPPQSIKRPSFLSGAKRSLTNAREYLRKYQPINMTNTVNVISNLQPTLDESDLYDEIEIALRSIE